MRKDGKRASDAVDAREAEPTARGRVVRVAAPHDLREQSEQDPLEALAEAARARAAPIPPAPGEVKSPVTTAFAAFFIAFGVIWLVAYVTQVSDGALDWGGHLESWHLLGLLFGIGFMYAADKRCHIWRSYKLVEKLRKLGRK